MKMETAKTEIGEILVAALPGIGLVVSALAADFSDTSLSRDC